MAADGEGSRQADFASVARPSGKLFRTVRLLIALVICGVLVAWAGHVIWETRNPAVAAARNLRSSDQTKRLEAIDEVAVEGLTNPQDSVAALIESLADKDEKVRAAAAKAIGFVSSYAFRSKANVEVARDSVKALRASAKDSVPAVRIESARSLGILGGIGLASPRRGATGGRGTGETAAKNAVDAHVLAKVFGELSGDTDAGVRLLVWQALGAAGPRLGIELPQALMAGLETEPPANREAAVKALAAYGPAAAPTIPVLIKFLKVSATTKDGARDAESIARALGRIAPGTAMASETVTSLTEALQSESPLTRLAAVQALERIGPQHAASAVPKVKAHENDPDPKVREAAKSAIKSLAEIRGKHGSL